MKLTIEEFLQKRIKSRPSFVFDLRSLEEFETEHIAGAHNLPFEFLESNLHRLPFNGDLLFYDYGEGTAQKAGEIIEENGFTDNFHVEEGYQTLKENLADPKYQLKMHCDGDDTKEVKLEVLQNLLDFEINPMVASHGGTFQLVNVEGNNVYVTLGGGCQGCGMADVTLRKGVEKRMREVFPDMENLIDTTDHAEGENPFYQPES